jgi:CheY-like chemotaxis protein
MNLVLVCDDSTEIRLLLVSLLKNMGLRAILASNGREGVSMVRRFHPDLVISDIIMPEMNGFQMLRAVKEDITLDGLPWIFMSSPDLREEAMRMGCTQFLPKPFTVQALEESVKSALYGRATQQVR